MTGAAAGKMTARACPRTAATSPTSYPAGGVTVVTAGVVAAGLEIPTGAAARGTARPGVWAMSFTYFRETLCLGARATSAGTWGLVNLSGA